MRRLLAPLLFCLATLISSPAGAAAVPLQNATADFSQSVGSFFVSGSIDGNTGDNNGWAIDPQEGQSHIAVYETVTDTGFAGGTLLTFTIMQNLSRGLHELGHFRISITTDARTNFADGLQSGGDVTANWIVLDPATISSANGSTLTEQPDFSILASGSTPSTDTYTITALTSATGITGFRLEALTDPTLPNNGPGRNTSNGNFVLTEFSVDAVAMPVPEASTLSLLIVGAMGGLLIHRRRLRA